VCRRSDSQGADAVGRVVGIGPTGVDVPGEVDKRAVVERSFNQLKGFRGIATRYDKTATSYEAAVSLASILLWARSV
jgi:hypothetical protein